MTFMKKNLDKVASDKSKLTDKRRIKIMKGGDPRDTGGFTALRESQKKSMSVLGQITAFDIQTRMRNSISTYN